MNSIIMNFDNSSDINTAFTQLKKQYPKVRITKTDIDFEELEDEYLLELALERKENDDGTRYSHEEVLQMFGVTRERLNNVGDVEIK